MTKPNQTIAQAITRAMNGGAPLTAAERARLTPAERAGVDKIIVQNNAAIKAGKAQAITDPKLTGVRTAKGADKRGPKAGSARANQSAKYADPVPLTKADEPNAAKRATANAKATEASRQKRQPTAAPARKGYVPGHDVKLVTGKGATGRTVANMASANKGHDTVVILNDGSTHVVTKMLGAGVTVKLGRDYDKCAAEYAALVAADDVARSAAQKGPAALARGAEGEVHSRKAAADSRKGGKAPAKAEKPAKAPKAEKPAKAPKNADRAYGKGKKEDTSKAGTWRNHMLTVIMAHKDTGAAKAAHAKSGKFPGNKLDFNWSAQQGYIVFAK